jgi:hypothetical protein
MSGKNKTNPTLGSQNSRDGGYDKEQIIVATETGFFDAMLTFGWLAERRGNVLEDNALRVIEVNDALRFWLRENRLTDILDELRHGIPLKDFLQRILQDEHAAVGKIVAGNLIAMTQEVEMLNYEKVISSPEEYASIWDKLESPYTLQQTLRFVADSKDQSLLTVLAGVRVVAPGAIRLRSNSERDRVDLVSVCQVLRTGAGWHVGGYQGLLQQAWLRVKATVTAGTQAGTVGLMGRNMSHNIGSHALFYLESDEPPGSRKTFFRYLRERMELLAGFATSMPLSSSTGRISKVIEGFRNNEELLTRIAKSEHVEKVDIFDEGTDRDVALPGGILSAQALYAILENNIRDSAKHGRTKRSRQEDLKVQVTVKDPEQSEFKDDFIEIVISDNRNNFKFARAGLEASLRELRIVDEVGRLMPGDWGIKERFICAALLRGLRLEDIPVQVQVGRKQEIKFELGEYAPPGEPRILNIRDVNGNLGWVFYLLKPKDILLIGNKENLPDELTNRLKLKFGERINIHSNNWLQWLKDNISLPSKVRHRFVVVYVKYDYELAELELLTDKLPYRVIICLPSGLTPQESSAFAPIKPQDLDLENLSLARLYHLWVAYLVELKKRTAAEKSWKVWLKLRKSPDTPEVAFSYNGIKLLSLDESTGEFHWQSFTQDEFVPNRPVVLFDRHGKCKQQDKKGGRSENKTPEWQPNCERFHNSILHYEPYDTGDSTSYYVVAATRKFDPENLDQPLEESELGFTFLEAGLTKILIVDERLDPTSANDRYQPFAGDWSCSLKEVFEWKGIDIRGEEYARDDIPNEDLLIKWTRKAHSDRKAGFDFLVLHKGIVDKLIKRGKKDDGQSDQELMATLFARLHENVRHIIIHSGRMSSSELPSGVKFMSLSNVDTWIKNNSPKTKIVEDLYLLRRP